MIVLTKLLQNRQESEINEIVEESLHTPEAQMDGSKNTKTEHWNMLSPFSTSWKWIKR